MARRKVALRKPAAVELPHGGHPIARMYRAFQSIVDVAGEEFTADELHRHWLRAAYKWEGLAADFRHVTRPAVTMYFVLLSDTWFATDRGWEVTGMPGSSAAFPYLRYTLMDYDDDKRETGSSVNGLATFGTWAECTADNTPSLPMPNWVDHWPYPEPQPAAEAADEEAPDGQ